MHVTVIMQDAANGGKHASFQHRLQRTEPSRCGTRIDNGILSQPTYLASNSISDPAKYTRPLQLGHPIQTSEGVDTTPSQCQHIRIVSTVSYEASKTKNRARGFPQSWEVLDWIDRITSCDHRHLNVKWTACLGHHRLDRTYYEGLNPRALI